MAAHTADLHRPALSRALPILILEGRAGQGRRRWIEERLQESAASGARIFFADCDFESAGPWAGVKSLFMELLPDIQAQRPDLVERHAAELVHILPQLTSSMTGKRENLTDLAPQGERVRSYAADRAFRIVHGLIDLLDRWKSSTCPGLSWVIGCDSYGQAGRMSSQFFRELMRRRGDRLGLRLVVGVNRGEGEAARISLKAGPGVEIMAVDFPAEPAPTVDRSTAEQMADMIERQIGDDVIAKQVHLADLIRLSQHAGRQEKVIRLKYFAMNVFLQLGLYEDALRYSDGLLRQAGECLPGDWELRWSIMIKTLSALMGTQKAEAAIELASEAARNLAEHAKPAWRVDFWYLFAMLYARFRSPRDFAMGEQYLDRGLAELERAGLPESESHFNYVFNRNGLAMIRTFQGRHQDALELCRSGIDRMNRHVDPDKHRLHRSVLIYNIAQVCTAVGQYEEALEHFSTVIAMDPNYSEYYNERGNLMLRLERLEEARADYLKAIELSPPYFEVFTNLGQCYRNMGNPAEAIQSYSRALDLEPERPLPLVGRAQCHEELGNAPAAIADYSAALNLDATMWDVFASRGVMHYETGDLPASLADFNRALELAPDQIGLYKNRAIVLFDLGRRSEAALDLRTGLSLNPMDEERAEMQARLNMALEAIASE